MPCSRIVALLMDFLEGRLPPSLQADLDRHLAGCPACVVHLRTYRSTLSLLESLTEEDLPPELRTSLRAFLDLRATS
jgi:RNA polymerase sigma-70 factor (ECF subfamily)